MSRPLFSDVPEARRKLMARVRQAHTKPELVVRRALHAMGKRFRLQRRDLPGRPDIVLPRHHLAMFVHGCFWHRHHGCRGATTPKTNAEYWEEKFVANVERDARNESALRKAGWRVAVIWECETRDATKLAALLKQHLEDGGSDDDRGTLSTL